MERGLSIGLLGSFRIRHQGESIYRINSTRLQELLAWLLLNHDPPKPRRYIAYRLWPESSEKQTKTNLRNLIYKVRKVLSVQRSGYRTMDVRLYPETRNLSYGLATAFLLEAEKAGNLSAMDAVWQQVSPNYVKKVDFSKPD